MKHARSDYQDRVVDLAKMIPADEPVVLLRAQDKCALPALYEYIARLYAVGADQAFISMMERHVHAFQDWPKKKVPDGPRAPVPQTVHTGFPA